MLFRVLLVVGFYFALLGIWQGVVELEIWKPYVVPPPREVWESFWDYADKGLVSDAIQTSMRRLIIGYTVSLVIGVIIGMAAGTWKAVDQTIGSLVLGMQSLPSITWLPLAVLWFGITERAIIFVVLMGSIFAIAISARSGVRNIPPLYQKAALTMGANRVQLTRYVLLPAMLPAMAQGLKLGWSFAWRSLMAGELIFLSGGLGQLLNLGRDLNDMSLVIAIMLVIVAIGLAVDVLLFGRLESWVRERWGYAAA